MPCLREGFGLRRWMMDVLLYEYIAILIILAARLPVWAVVLATFVVLTAAENMT